MTEHTRYEYMPYQLVVPVAVVASGAAAQPARHAWHRGAQCTRGYKRLQACMSRQDFNYEYVLVAYSPFCV